MNNRTQIAWWLPIMALAMVFSDFVSSGQQSGKGGYNQKYPAKGGGWGKNVGQQKGNPSGSNKGGSVGGSGPGITRPTITLSIFRLRLRSFRTPQVRRMPPTRPTMSAINGARFQRGAAKSNKAVGGQSGQTSTKGNSGQGKSSQAKSNP